MKDLSLHVMDILQNSTRAGATKIELVIVEDVNKDTYTLQFVDNGCGMNEETLQKVIDPFFTTRTVRKVGLGLPLIKQNAERTGGSFRIQSQPGQGTTVQVVFSHQNIDRPTLGDIAGAVVLTASAFPNIHFIYKHIKNGKEYVFDTVEVNEVLDGISIQDPEIIQYLREMITENLKEMGVEF
jgi:anti-sigma regulatory factor (Ser/Thr protein kinase)